MLDTYLDQLPLCASPEEVWHLMSGREFPNSDGTKFEDEILYLQISARRFQSVVPPEELIGLAYRTMLYLKLEGVFGKIITGSGVYTVGSKLERVIRELSTYGKIEVPSDISSMMLDKHIEAESNRGKNVTSTYAELYNLEQWAQHSHRVPFFLRLNENLFDDSLAWKELVHKKSIQNRNYYNGIGGTSEPYPLDQLTTIVGEAIDYIDEFSEDCLIAAHMYKEIKVLNFTDNANKMRACKHLRSNKHRYKEPFMKLVQVHALKLKSNNWRAIPHKVGYGPFRAAQHAIRKLQGACLIIVLMLTAMRKGELNTLERYPEIEKMSHHELDGSVELARIIHKTSLSKNGEPLKMPVPNIVLKAVYLLSELSEINDGERKGYLNFSTFIQERNDHHEGRVNVLIHEFCDGLQIDAPTSHQFRHAMAFIVAYMNDAHGIELAMTMLGHKSIEMTKKYLGQYKLLVQKTFDAMYEENEAIREVYEELKERMDADALEKIITEIEQGNPMVGPVVRRISQFSGSLTNDAKVFFSKSLRLVVEKGMFAVTQFPTHFCIKDLTDPAQMACQIGLNREDYIGAPVVPSQCEPKCGHRLYTGENIGMLKELTDEVEEAYPDELRERLSQCTYFDAESFTSPFTQYIEEYEEIIEKRSS